MFAEHVCAVAYAWLMALAAWPATRAWLFAQRGAFVIGAFVGTFLFEDGTQVEHLV